MTRKIEFQFVCIHRFFLLLVLLLSRQKHFSLFWPGSNPEISGGHTNWIAFRFPYLINKRFFWIWNGKEKWRWEAIETARRLHRWLMKVSMGRRRQVQVDVDFDFYFYWYCPVKWLPVAGGSDEYLGGFLEAPHTHTHKMKIKIFFPLF